MARRKDPTYVVLGTYDTPTKVCALDFKPACGTMALRIFELGNEDGKYAYGDMDAVISPADIQFEYMRIYLCKKESLAALIRTLQRGYALWDDLEANRKRRYDDDGKGYGNSREVRNHEKGSETGA